MAKILPRPSSTSLLLMLLPRLLPRRVFDLCSRVLAPTFSVVLLVLVCSPSTTKSNSSCSARSSRVVPVKRISGANIEEATLYRWEGGDVMGLGGGGGCCGKVDGGGRERVEAVLAEICSGLEQQLQVVDKGHEDEPLLYSIAWSKFFPQVCTTFYPHLPLISTLTFFSLLLCTH